MMAAQVNCRFVGLAVVAQVIRLGSTDGRYAQGEGDTSRSLMQPESKTHYGEPPNWYQFTVSKSLRIGELFQDGEDFQEARRP